MTNQLKFAVISTIIAFILGLIIYMISIAGEHIYFFLSAPIATFFPAYFIWKRIFKKSTDYKINNIVGVSVILTIVTHYLNFVVLGLGRLVCYYLTGGCTDYNGEVESLFGTLTHISLLRMLISLYSWGLISLVLYILIGVYMMRTHKIQS